MGSNRFTRDAGVERVREELSRLGWDMAPFCKGRKQLHKIQRSGRVLVVGIRTLSKVAPVPFPNGLDALDCIDYLIICNNLRGQPNLIAMRPQAAKEHIHKDSKEEKAYWLQPKQYGEYGSSLEEEFGPGHRSTAARGANPRAPLRKQQETHASKKAGKTAADSKNKVCVITACGNKKRDRPSPAWQLYKSSRITAVYRRRDGCDMYILSAKHGLLPSEKIIAPYNQIMDPERAGELLPGMIRVLQGYDRVVYFKAGASGIYEECMREACERAGRPLDSFGYGFMGGIGELGGRLEGP